MNKDKETLIDSLMYSKEWSREAATAFVESMIAHEQVVRERVPTAQRQKFAFDKYPYLSK